MINGDIKKIRDAIKQEIKTALKPVNDKLDKHTAILQQHGTKLDTHTLSLVKIEQTLEGYSDMYKINKEKNEKLDKRVSTLEDHLSIAPQE